MLYIFILLEQQSSLIEAVSSLSQSVPSYEEMLGRVSHVSAIIVMCDQLNAIYFTNKQEYTCHFVYNNTIFTHYQILTVQRALLI